MHLSVHTDYSLRLLMYLALKGGTPATVAEAAEHLRVSRNHLMKVVYRLGRGGYVHTLRGRSGGFRLARAPAEISLGDVVRYTETDMAVVPCFAAGEITCTFLPDCTLRQAMHGALAAFVAALERFSVADLTVRHGPLQALLRQDRTPDAVPARGRRPAKPD